MRGMDFHRAAALGERHKRAFHDRMTGKHRADNQSRARRGIRAMALQRRRQEIHTLLCAGATIRRAAADEKTNAQHDGTMPKARGVDGFACRKALLRLVPRRHPCPESAASAAACCQSLSLRHTSRCHTSQPLWDGAAASRRARTHSV